MAVFILVCFIIYIIYTNNNIQKYRDEIKKLKDKINSLEDSIIERKSEILSNNEIKKEYDNFSDDLEIKKRINELNGEKNEIKNVQINLNTEENISNNVILNGEKEEKASIKNDVNLQNKKIQAENLEFENKNTLILITGAILIVLSAIVFLMSTWAVVPNIIKTGVLFLLIGVFLGISKIAKEKFNLPKTSDTFFYISMAYIPVFLLSISVFELFGNYFSLNGDGRYLYLTFVFAATSSIYYLNYKIRNSKSLLYGSILSQVFSVILFSLIFSNNFLLIIVNLALYNILLIILTSESNIFVKEMYFIIPYLAILGVISNLFTADIFEVVLILVTAINFLFLELKFKDLYNSYIFNFLLYLFGMYLMFTYIVNLIESEKILFSVIYMSGVCLIESLLLINTDKIHFKKSTVIFYLIFLEIINIFNLFYEESYLQTYIISILQLLTLLFIYFKTNILNKTVCSIFIPILFFAIGYDIILKIDAPYYYNVIFSLIAFVIASIINEKKYEELYKICFIYSHINILIIYLLSYSVSVTDYGLNIFYIIILMGVYLYSYRKFNNFKFFKLAVYFLFNILLLSIFNKLNATKEIKYLIPTITTIGLSIFEGIKNKDDDIFGIYIIISEIVSYMYLCLIGKEFGIIVTLLFSAYLLIYNYYINREDDIINIVPLLGVIPYLFTYDNNEIFLLGIYLICFLPTTVLSILKKKINIYTIFSGIYLFIYALNSYINCYLIGLLFFGWSCIHIFYFENKKEKDIFKFLTFSSLLYLYSNLINDIELTEYTLFKFLGIIIFAILCIRKILINYIEEIDVIETITFIIIYLLAIASYSGETDGILFVLLIVGLVILSYIKKYGCLFLVSIGSILLNVFLLTREFWFSIPWWVYLLGIGSILIIFAIRNEAKEEKVNLGTIIKKIKDKVE